MMILSGGEGARPKKIQLPIWFIPISDNFFNSKSLEMLTVAFTVSAFSVSSG